MTEPYRHGDLVEIPPERGMTTGRAVVLSSYREQFGEGRADTFTVLFTETGAEVSWFDAQDFVRLGRVSDDEIVEIRQRRDDRHKEESQLPWIVAHWAELRPPHGRASGASMNALMALIGITEPWGRHGEGIVWYRNAIDTAALFDDVLLAGDVAAVEHRAAQIRAWRQGLA